MHKRHHIRIAEHALALAPKVFGSDSVLVQIAARERLNSRLLFGSWAPDTVAFWTDHIVSFNPYNAVDAPDGRAIEVVSGLVDVVATLLMPYGDIHDVAFLLGCMAHVAADLNQPYHVDARHSVDALEHREFERVIQDFALKFDGPPDIVYVTEPTRLEGDSGYFRAVTVPRSFATYRDVAGNKDRWSYDLAFEIHTRAVHDVLVVWGVVEREAKKREDLMKRLADVDLNDDDSTRHAEASS